MLMETLIPLGMALLSLSIGVGAIILPGVSSVMYGAVTKDRGFVQAAGIRDLFIAVVIFELWRVQEHRLLFLSILALALVSAGDAGVTWFSGNRKRSPLHLIAAIVTGVYSLYMLNR